MKILSDPPRELRLSRTNESKFTELRKFLEVKDQKDAFLFAMRIGAFNNIRKKLPAGKDKQGRNLKKHVVGVSSLSDEQIVEMIVIAAPDLVNQVSLREYVEEFTKVLEGKEVAKICEEFANGGIEFIHNIISRAGVEKSKVQILEDIIDSVDDGVDFTIKP